MAPLSFYTLFLTLAVTYLSLAAVPSANALQGMNLAPPPVAKRAEHANLNQRMIKKKRAADDVPINPGAAAVTPSESASTPVTPTGSTTPPVVTPSNTSTPSVSISSTGIILEIYSNFITAIRLK